MNLKKFRPIATKLKDNKLFKISFVVIVIGLTAAYFVYYISQHHQVLNSLEHVKITTILAILLVYLSSVIVLLILNNIAILIARGQPLKFMENLKLNSYSILANFFIPLQTGPGVRAIYIKKQQKLPIARYIVAFLVYYAVYAVISAMLVFSTSKYWWAIIPVGLFITYFALTVFRLIVKKLAKKNDVKLLLSRRNICYLLATVILQLLVQSLIYLIEIKSVNKTISYPQILSYTGAGAYSLFVSLTPGAIGFKEALLLLSTKLNAIPTATVISASIIDRGVYLLFLVIIIILVISIHAQKSIKKVVESKN